MTTTRRRFLKGMGLGLSTPLLYPIIKNLYAEETGATPKRFVFLVEANGIEPSSFMSPKMRKHLEDHTGATGLKEARISYERYKHDTVQIVEGADLSEATCLGSLAGDGSTKADLQPHATVLLGLSSKITGGGHHTNFSALSSTRAHRTPVAATIDHHLSTLEAVRQQTIFDAVRLTVGGNGKVAYDTCAKGPGEIAPMMLDPVSAFNRLFGWSATGQGARTFKKRNRLLSLAQKDADEAIKAFSGSSGERLKLERYLNGIDDMIAEQSALAARRAECGIDTGGDGMACDFKPLEPGSDGTLYEHVCPLKRMEAHTDLAISALRGGLTNVVVLGAGTGIFRWDVVYHSLKPMFPGDLKRRHDVCHGASDPALLAIMHEVTRQYVGMAARLARALLAEEEPSSPGDSMLDHTAIVVMSDNGEKHHPKAEEWPILLIGGKKMNLKTGNRGVIYPAYKQDKNRVVTDLFVTLDNLAGGKLDVDPKKPEESFGQDAPSDRKIKAPLDELYA